MLHRENASVATEFCGDYSKQAPHDVIAPEGPAPAPSFRFADMRIDFIGNRAEIDPETDSTEFSIRS